MRVQEDTVWSSLADVEHQVRFIDVEGVRTRCLEAGEGSDVVLLHGTGGHLEAFARNIGPLSRRHRVLAIDLLGHGFTDKPPDRTYDWPDLSAHLLAAASELGLDRPVLVGEGVGAQIAQWIALHHPDRTRGVVLCSTIIPLADDAGDPSSAESMGRFQALTRRALEDPTYELMRERMEWLFLDPSDVTLELVAMRTRMWADDGFRSAQRALLRSYVDPEARARNAISQAQLENCAVPTLVVWSDHNPLMSLDLARRFCSHLPNARLEVFHESAMWPQHEQAGAFNDLVLDFITAIDGEV
jgi:2-hydroxy-6-oxonona-2,4-dienedioate hydrolase